VLNWEENGNDCRMIIMRIFQDIIANFRIIWA
jgi:hypothetical protein